jgi:hypothetical protein
MQQKGHLDKQNLPIYDWYTIKHFITRTQGVNKCTLKWYLIGVFLKKKKKKKENLNGKWFTTTTCTFDIGIMKYKLWR